MEEGGINYVVMLWQSALAVQGTCIMFLFACVCNIVRMCVQHHSIFMQYRVYVGAASSRHHAYVGATSNVGGCNITGIDVCGCNFIDHVCAHIDMMLHARVVQRHPVLQS